VPLAFAFAVALAFLAVIPQRSEGICFSTASPSSRTKVERAPAFAFAFAFALAFAFAFAFAFARS
jgi:hypothetical protein